MVKDLNYFDDLWNLMYSRYKTMNAGRKEALPFGQTLVFSMDGSTTLTARALEYHFTEMMSAIDVDNLEDRNLVPYSFRHYFITDMINKGATPMQVAETCGTSSHQIEHTYYHTTDAKMIANALPQFEYKNGLLYPK